MNPDDAVEILARTPGTLRALLGGLSEGWSLHEPDPGWWSARDVLGHLIHGELTDWVPRARIIVAHGESRAFDPFDREGWRAARGDKTVAELLDEFEGLRARNLETLRALDLSMVDARGTHPAFGAVTLGQLIATWAVHDLNHLGQITEALAKRYREAIGPWRAYLPIVNRAREDSD